MSTKDRRDLNKMLGLKSEIVGGDPPVPTMGEQKSPEVPATLPSGGNPPVPKMGKQKSPAEPATLQYVGYLLKDGSRVLMTRKVFMKVNSEKFRQDDGNWENVTSLAFKAYEGTQEGVKIAMNTAWIAAEMERMEAAKLRESQEYVALHLQKPCERPSVFAGGRIGRSASGPLDLSAFEEAMLKDDLAGMPQRRYSI